MASNVKLFDLISTLRSSIVRTLFFSGSIKPIFAMYSGNLFHTLLSTRCRAQMAAFLLIPSRSTKLLLLISLTPTLPLLNTYEVFTIPLGTGVLVARLKTSETVFLIITSPLIYLISSGTL
jgi:hypothetical protein